jgi:hypothetical protein
MPIAGYTSYASLNDLPLRDPDLRRTAASALDNRHVAASLLRRLRSFDLGGRKLKLDSLWVNVLKHGRSRIAGHIHPHSAWSRAPLYVARARRAHPGHSSWRTRACR